jgi:hypothetical protein
MKLYDFGLWFRTFAIFKDGDWSTSIPQNSQYRIFYDGAWLGTKFIDQAHISENERFMIKLKNPIIHSPRVISNGISLYEIDTLTLDDFEIILNPRYQEPT